MNEKLLSKQLPPAIKKVWRNNLLLDVVIFTVIGVVAIIVVNLFDAFQGVWLWILGGYFCFFIIVIILGFIFIPYRYHYFRYEVTPQDLAFQKGYIFRSSTYVPISRIQHVETEQGPFLRRENLMELKIHTAATTHHIAGLSMEDASQLRSKIIALVKVVNEDV